MMLLLRMECSCESVEVMDQSQWEVGQVARMESNVEAVALLYDATLGLV